MFESLGRRFASVAAASALNDFYFTTKHTKVTEILN